MKSIIIGGSAGLGRALAHELAKNKHDIFLVSSDEKDLKAIASDLGIRNNIKCFYKAIELNDFDAISLRNEVLNNFNVIDNLFIVAGFSPNPYASGQVDDDIASKIINVNMTSAIRIINLFLDILENSMGNIVGIGSTAAVRPRKFNSIYGSSKKGLEFYFGTLQHYLFNKKCHVQFYRVGYLDTSMTSDLKLVLPKQKPANVARNIVNNLGNNKPIIYEPYWWKGIMFIYNLLPKVIHNRINM